MTKTLSIQDGAVRRKWAPSPWTLAVIAIAAMVVLPIASVLWIAATPTENIWPHLVSTTLPRYLGNSLVLMVSVALLAAAIGVGAAWLVTMYRFPFARLLEWMLLLPLALPAYVGAYALVDFLEYAGPVQTAMRDVFGWQNSRDYWFPEIRSRGAAILVLAAALYPYVYILCRAAFREQSGNVYEVARVLGVGPWGRFWRIGMPLARPALAAGAALVMMETVNDFGVVDFFAVQTLTTGIFTVWLEGNNAGGAAQIASVVLIVVLVLVAMEKISRRKMRFFNPSKQARLAEKITLKAGSGALAAMFCALPFAFGFLLPVCVLLTHVGVDPSIWFAPGLVTAIGNTVMVGGFAAIVTLTAALLLVYGVRLTGHQLPRLLLPATTIGYAAPGAVLAIGILIPMAAFDHKVADFLEAALGVNVGLLITGSATAVIFAYCVRFFAIGLGAMDSATGRVAPSLPMAARLLGRNRRQTLGAVYWPLIRGSYAVGLLLVFVDCVKELPATLLLRPFGFDTLATRVYEKASLEDIAGAAPAALMVVAVSLVAVILLEKAHQ